MSASRPKISTTAIAADAAGPERAEVCAESTSISLSDRLVMLEQEKFSLLKIICELLTKNEELRSQIRDEAPRGSQAS
jgi:hypothetical protein